MDKKKWEIKTLGDCGTFTRGGNFLKSDFVEDGVPCVHYGQIHTKFGLSIGSHLTCIPKEKAKKMASKGDLLIAITSEDVEGSCKCTAWLGNYDVALGGHSAIYKHNLHPLYVAYYFNSASFYREKSKYTHGFKVVEIKPSDIAKIPIPVPPLAEQQEIVDYLDKAFAKIDALKKNAEQQLSDAKALFSAALEEVMTPKEGWLHVKFGDIATYHKETFQGPGLPYIGMENIEGNTGQLLSHSYSDTVLSNSFRFKSGEVLYGRLRPYLKKVCVATFDGCCSTEIFPISSNRVLSPYLKYWFLTDTITNKINETCSGCRMPRGNMNEVKKFNFSYPKTLPEQQAIVAHLDALSSKVNQLQKNYNKILRECDALKQAFLREIFE